jgi:hypothetical protein
VRASPGSPAAANSAQWHNTQSTNFAHYPNPGLPSQQQNSSYQQYHYTGNPSTGAYPNSLSPNYNAHSGHTLPRGRGDDIRGAYQHGSPSSLHYELIDPSFYVRSKPFFHEGKVFSVIMNETAGSTAATPYATDYNTSRSINAVKYQDNWVHTNVRRFVVVRQKREFCFACPIYTYSGRGTTKHGVQASEHGIAYSSGSQPTLLPGEFGITKVSLPVIMTPGERFLDTASRIYYGIHHPIQYNVKVKDVGHVVPELVYKLIDNWKEEDGGTQQSQTVTAHAEVPQERLEGRTETENTGDGADNNDDPDGGGDGVDQEGAEMGQLTQNFSGITVQTPLIVGPSHYPSSQSAQQESSKHRSTKGKKRSK